MQEMRFTVAWAVLYSCLVKWACGVAILALCVNCGMCCGLLVAR